MRVINVAGSVLIFEGAAPRNYRVCMENLTSERLIICILVFCFSIFYLFEYRTTTFSVRDLVLLVDSSYLL